MVFLIKALYSYAYKFIFLKMKKIYIIKLLTSISLTLILVNLFPSGIRAQVLQVSSSITPEEMVEEILIGGGVVTSNIEYTGANISRGEFWGGPGNIGIVEGII